MHLPRALRHLALLAVLGSPLLALDFPAAVCRLKIGAQETSFTVGESGRPITIDGKPARAGERRNSLMRVNWIIAPVDGVGDEYVFTVRRPLQKPRTFSAVFKGGYLQVAAAEDLLIEVEVDD
jgi:hypothetical protein